MGADIIICTLENANAKLSQRRNCINKIIGMYNFKTKSDEQKCICLLVNELFRRFSMQFELCFYLVSTSIIITTMLIIYNIEFTIL